MKLKYSQVLSDLGRLNKKAFVPSPSTQDPLAQAYTAIEQMVQGAPPQIQQQVQEQLQQLQGMPPQQQAQALQQLAQQLQQMAQGGQGGAPQGGPQGAPQGQPPQGAPGQDPSAQGGQPPQGQDPNAGAGGPPPPQGQDPNAGAPQGQPPADPAEQNKQTLDNQMVTVSLGTLLDAINKGQHSLNQTKIQTAKHKGHYANELARLDYEKKLKEREKMEQEAQAEEAAQAQAQQQQNSLGNLMGGGINPPGVGGQPPAPGQ